MANPAPASVGASVSYETLGRTPPHGIEGATALWPIAHQKAMRSPDAVHPEGSTGVAPDELATTAWRDPIAGTPWHEHVPARLEAVAR